MKVKMNDTKLGPCFGIGEDEKGEKHKVYGGDLVSNQIVEIEPFEKGGFILTRLNYHERSLFEDYLDEEGLIDYNLLKEVANISGPYKRVFELGGYWVFIPAKIHQAVEYLIQNGLTEFLKLRITNAWVTVRSGAAIISINYESLITKTIESYKDVKSWFYCDKTKDLNQGVYADLLVIGNKKGKQIQLQMWQFIGDSNNAFYAHGIMDKDNLKFEHFDLAIHYTSKEEIQLFLDQNKRMDLLKKEKWIRIDSAIDRDTMLSLIESFFPNDQLVNEFYEAKNFLSLG